MLSLFDLVYAVVTGLALVAGFVIEQIEATLDRFRRSV